MLDSEDAGIKISLHVPKQPTPKPLQTTSKVDEFLADNHEYLNESKHEKDSELPDDYDSEQDSSGSSVVEEESDATSSSMSSMLVSPAQADHKKQQYNMDEIDRIIREAKEQKKKLQGMASEEESSMSESGFDQRYL